MKLSSRGVSSIEKGASGQALVEFALVFPIFLLLLLGTIEFARAWNIYEVLTDAGREGVRRAVIGEVATAEADVVTQIRAAGLRAGTDIDAADIRITGFRSGRGNTTWVKIEYERELRRAGGLLALATGERKPTLVSEFAMRNE